MAAESSVIRVCEDIRQIVSTRLRDEYPYLKDNALEHMLEAAMSSLNINICKQELVMAATKARTGFLTLPAEIRNTIYEIALQSLKEDDDSRQGGPIDFCLRTDGTFLTRCTMPNLLAVSRQIREEILPMFWKDKSLSIQVESFQHQDKKSQRSVIDKYYLKEEVIRQITRLGPASCGLIDQVVLDIGWSMWSPTVLPCAVEELAAHLDLAAFGLRAETVQVDAWAKIMLRLPHE